MESNLVRPGKISDEIEKSLEQIKWNGTMNPTSEIYYDFNGFAYTLGLQISFSVFKDSKSSAIAVYDYDLTKVRKAPSLTIYLKTTQNMIENNIDMQNNNWSGKYGYNTRLIEKWDELLEKYHYPSTYKNPVILIYSLEDFVMIELVSLCKDEIHKRIEVENINFKPEYIFATSHNGYGYNIIFKTKNDYTLFMKNSEKTITSFVHQIIKKNDIWGYYKYEKIRINYLHREMDNINMYGLSRED